MKTIFAVLFMLFALPVLGQTTKTVTLRAILLEQLRTTHGDKDWFVPINIAVAGLTADQAKWKDASGNHSAGQLTNHLLFWNERELAKIKGEPEKKFSGNNEETFNDFDSKTWSETVKKLDLVMSEIEKFVETADEQKLQTYASEIAHIGTHNAYHVGQIIVIRRLQGAWNPENGVK
jgi:uncharacterized damage-inducible protein DinB